jgi:hypothetical protein
MKDKYGITPELLKELHSELKMTPAQIADKLGCHHTTVRYYLNKYSIEKLPKYERLEGMKFGRLTVKVFKRADRNAIWDCLCDCGNTVEATTAQLKFGKVKSCGCLSRERSTTHGMANTRPYNIWRGMKSRCTNPNEPNYQNYGGRGINYDPSWETFEGFWRDMKEGYAADLVIERIDNNQGYSKANCRWATVEEQGYNMRTNVNLTHNGKTQTITEWANELGLDRRRLYDLHDQGLSDEEIFRHI